VLAAAFGAATVVGALPNIGGFPHVSQTSQLPPPASSTPIAAAIKGGNNPKLKSWAASTLLTLQHHLDMAQGLYKKT
jgi:hypothetical protein